MAALIYVNVMYGVTHKGYETSETTVLNLTVCFIIFTIPQVRMPNHKISHKLRLYYYILGEGLTLTLGSTYFKRFKSSLQSHPLWVTL